MSPPVDGDVHENVPITMYWFAAQNFRMMLLLNAIRRVSPRVSVRALYQRVTP
jgi:hypothetical protein